MNAFQQIDHPFILIFQVSLFIGLIRLFFAIRHDPWPLPQIVGLMAFAVLANMTARARHWEWFYISDIVQYGLWTASGWASVFAVEFRRKKEALQPGAPAVATDFFDKRENKITIILGLIAIGICVWAWLETYSGLQTAKVDEKIAADSAVVATTQEYQCKQDELSQGQKAVLTNIASLSAQQATLLANQRKDSTQHKKTQSLVTRKAAQTQETVREAVQEKESTPKPKDDEKPKKNFWQRAKGFFDFADYRNAPIDSLQYARSVADPDSTLFR